jgi:ligand-binding sensor domain-containing protein
MAQRAVVQRTRGERVLWLVALLLLAIGGCGDEKKPSADIGAASDLTRDGGVSDDGAVADDTGLADRGLADTAPAHDIEIPDGKAAAPSVEALALAYDATKDVLWIGTQEGAVRVERKTGATQRYRVADGLASDEVHTIAVGKDSVWLGYRFAYCKGSSSGSNYCGVTRYQPSANSWTTFDKDDGMLDARAHVVKVASDNTVWAGLYMGLARRAPQGSNWSAWFDHHDCENPGTHCDKLWSYSVGDIAFAAGGVTWLAITTMQIGISPKPGGVARINADGTTDTWDKDHGLSSNVAMRITLVDGVPWAVSNNGAAYYDAKTNRFVEELSESVTDVAGLGGEVWLATPKGVRRRSMTGNWSSLTTADGLPHQQVLCVEPVAKAICFGTVAGVGCFDPTTKTWSYPL